MAKSPTFRFVFCGYVCLNVAFSVALPTITNVSVTCVNFKNFLYWNYSAPDLKPEFNVTIRGYQGAKKTVNTDQTYLDLSQYTQDAADIYYVEVEAQGEGSENVVSEGATLSYNDDLPADHKCSMDFPELDVSVLHRRVEISFRHPYNVHNLDALKAEFEGSVYYNETEKHFTCYEDEDVCTVEFLLSESLFGNCMNVQIGGSVNGIQAETDRRVCDHEAPDSTDWTLLLTILLCCGFGLMLLGIFGVVVYKKMTRPHSQNMLSNLMGKVKSHHVHVPEQPLVSQVTSVGENFSDMSSPGFEESTHPSVQFDGKFSDEQHMKDVTEEEDSGGFNSGNSFSGYDSQKFPIDMGQGDIVEAYGPR